MSTVVYPGSFDPITNGHVNLIQRAAAVFDHVIVCVMNNSSKKTPLFSIDERVNMIRSVTKSIPHVETASCRGLLVDFAAEHHVDAIVRGLRQVEDFDQEMRMAQANRAFSEDNLETVFLTADPGVSFVSSSIVREFLNYGRICRDFVPPEVYAELQKKMKKES